VDSVEEFLLFHDQFKEKIKKLKKEEKQDAIITYCDEHIPEPIAFIEKGIALRKKIRAARKLRHPFESDLNAFYVMVAYHSFILREFKFEVYSSLGMAKLAHNANIIRELDLNYDVLGYKEMYPDNAQEIKWFRELWGEPKQHKDPEKLYAKKWDRFIKDGKRLEAEMEAQAREEVLGQAGLDEGEGVFKKIILALFIIVILYFLIK
jgi:hypothetical protein